MKRLATLVAVLTLAGPAAARQQLESGGETYWQDCNANGYVLTPQSGAPPIYLGKSCDAFQQGRGDGNWCQANGGIILQLADTRIPFGRQEFFCPRGEDANFPTPCFCGDVFEAFE